MTLYDSIIEYETKQLLMIFEATAKENAIIMEGAKSNGRSLMQAEIEKARVLLDTVYNLGGNKINDSGLNAILQEFERIDRLYSGFGPSIIKFMLGDQTKVKSAKKEFIKETIIFYQQLIQQEDNVSTYEDAVRLQFKTESAYRTAVQPIYDAERQLMHATVSRFPSTVIFLEPSMKIAETIRYKMIHSIFSALID